MRERFANWLSGGLIVYWYSEHIKLADALWDVQNAATIEEAKQIAKNAIAKVGSSTKT